LPESVTVPVEDVPPVTEVGLTDIAVSAGGVTVKGAAAVTPARLPVIVSMVKLATATVDTLNVWLVCPAGIVTLAGTEADLPLLLSLTTRPPLGAMPFRDTVPVDGLPPATVEGLKLMAESAIGTSVNVAG
jgi:hypothetical protein